jgi:NAD(P)H-hydrate epimerase
MCKASGKFMTKETLKAPYSHYLLDAKLSRQIDQQTIEDMNISGFTLMEIAGYSAVRHILDAHPNIRHGVFFCGKGNNAGDALVAARYLSQHDINTTIVFISGTENLSKETQKNLNLLEKFAKKSSLSIISGWHNFSVTDTIFDFVVDGMLGTGLNSNVRGDYSSAIEWINKQTCPVFSMDMPTGLHADTGKVMGISVNATKTFAFGGLKIGCYLNDGPHVSGSVHYCELPFPNSYKANCQNFLLDETWVSTKSPILREHKYANGVLYLVAGSEGLTGAAIMAAKSAWEEGIGAIILLCPRGILPIFEQTLPEVIKKPVGTHEDTFFKDAHAQQVLEIIRNKAGKLLIGPGLGRNKSTVSFLKQLLPALPYDAVIDADGLWGLAQLSQWKKPDKTDWILTPHPGELHQLTQQNVNDDYQRLTQTIKYAQQHNVTILSKGMPGIVANPNGNNYLTNYDTRYFSRAGNGDVLAGKIGAFISLGYATDKSCAMGLLQGKIKLDRYLEKATGLPRPKYFI